MKNLLLILILAFSLNANAQLPQDLTLATNVLMSSNREFVQVIPDNYTWGLTVKWSAVTGTKNGVLKIQVSDDGVNYATYAGLDSLIINSTSSYAIFEDHYFAHKFLKVKYEKKSITGGKISALLILKPRK